MITKSEKAILNLSYFALTSEQKCYYAQVKLVEELYHWVKDNYKFCQYWSHSAKKFLYLVYFTSSFMHLRQTAKGLMLNKSLSLQADQSPISALSFGRP